MSKRILITILVIVAVVTMVILGFWQLDRHSQKTEINERINSRLVQPSIDLNRFILESPTLIAASEYEYRAITVSGNYKQSDSILVRNRSFNGMPGFWLLTPLELKNGSFVIINRGWIPISAEDYLDSETSAVEITGLFRKTELAKGLQKADTEEKDLDSLGRVDLIRYGKQLGYEIFPMYIQLTGQNPGQIDNFPRILDIPEFKEMQHLNYAVQWFIFATIAALGYPLVIYRNNKNRNKALGQSDIPIDYL
ncbi:MAG: SURF1 family protein [Actinomycetota bacterium]